MKRTVAAILAGLMIVSCLCGLVIFKAAADEPEFGEVAASIGAVSDLNVKDTSSEPIKLLMIGNSFSWNAFTYMKQIIQSTGRDVVCANLFYSGCSLEQHNDFILNNKKVYSYESTWQSNKENYSISDALADYDWDYISLQQVSGRAGRYEDTYQPYLNNVVGYLRNNAPNAEIIWHQTWAYQKTSDHNEFPFYDNDQDKMWEAIEYSSKKAAEVAGIRLIVPSGKAFQNARATSIGDNLNVDGYHANDYGKYIAGLCFFSTVTGMMPTDKFFTPSSIPAADAKLLRQAVKEAVYEYGYVQYSTKSDNTYYKALNKLKSEADGNELDGMIVAGNTITSSTADLNPFKAMCQDFVGNSIMFTLGDKDNTLGSKTGFYFSSTLKDFCNADLEGTAQKKLCNRHMIINGIHVIGISYDTLTDGFATYTDNTLAFLSAELATARAAAPGKPIFVVTSVPVSNTAGSRGKSRVCDILSEYPEVIAFSGNSPESLSADASVYQDGFTAVNTGTLSNDKGGLAEAVLAEVDTAGRVRIRRFNLTRNKEYPAIIIDVPDTENKTHLNRYNTGYFEAPVISLEEGSSYDVYTQDAPKMTWFQDGEKATLNGTDCPYGTEVTEPGEYTLTVTSGDKSSSVHFTVTSSAPPAYIKGDFDGDGAITVADALAALRIGAKLVEETPESVAIGDTDNDGHVTVADALAILRVAAKLTDSL